MLGTRATQHKMANMFVSNRVIDRANAARAGYKLQELIRDRSPVVRAHAYCELLKDHRFATPDTLMEMAHDDDEVALQAARRIATPQMFDIKNHRLLFMQNFILTDEYKRGGAHLRKLIDHDMAIIAKTAMKTLIKYNDKCIAVMQHYNRCYDDKSVIEDEGKDSGKDSGKETVGDPVKGKDTNKTNQENDVARPS